MNWKCISLVLALAFRADAICGGTTTISSAAEATALGDSCIAFQGTITIASESESKDIDLGGIADIGGELIVKDVSALQSLSAPSLANIYSVTIASNPELTNISMAKVQNIKQDLSITDNFELNVIEGFPKLQNVGGTINCVGDFTDVSLPALNNAGNGIVLKSSKNIEAACASFQGPTLAVKCESNEQIMPSSSASSASKTASPSSNNSDSLSTGAKAGIGVGVAIGALLVLALAFLLFRRRSRTNKIENSAPTSKTNGESDAAAMNDSYLYGEPKAELTTEAQKHELESTQAHELDQTQKYEQAHSQSQLAELPADQGHSELGRTTSSEFPGVESRHEK